MRRVLPLVVAAGAACAPNGVAPALHVFDGLSMGTTYTVRVVTGDELSESARDELATLIQGALDEIESAMSHYRPDSELSRFNRARHTDPVPVSGTTFAVFEAAQAISERTGGALDVTVGPLVNAWGFGPVEPETLPPPDALLERLRGSTGYTRLELDAAATTLRKTVPEVEADLSAVAKGYGVDRVAAALEGAGRHRFMVEVGGEIVTRGANQQGRPWRIAIERPTAEGGVQQVVPMTDLAMATSGDYRNVREVEGRLVSHTIDPRTGRPVSHALASVTVLTDSCLQADGLATALEVLGPDDGFALATELELAALFLVRDGDDTVVERATPRFEAMLSR